MAKINIASSVISAASEKTRERIGVTRALGANEQTSPPSGCFNQTTDYKEPRTMIASGKKAPVFKLPDENGTVHHVIEKVSPKTHDEEVLAALAEL